MTADAPENPQQPGSGRDSSLEEEMRAVVDRHQAALLGYAGRLLRNADLAQDIVQEAFLRYLKQRRQGLPVEHEKAWLYRVTHNLALDHIRRNQRGESALAEYQADNADRTVAAPDAAVTRRDARREALQLLQTLPEREQQIVLMKVVEGKSYKEIAAAMDISTGNVGFILHTAFKKLGRAARKREA